MTPRLNKFLELINDQISINADDDNYISFEEGDFKAVGLTLTDIDRDILYLEREDVIKRSTFWRGESRYGLPVTVEAKIRAFGIIAQLFRHSDSGIVKYVIELTSRNKFLDFYKVQVSSIGKPIISNPKANPQFDFDKSELTVFGQTISISRKTDKTNGHYLLVAMFKNPEGIGAKHYYADIHDFNGDKEMHVDGMVYYRAASDINEKVRKGTTERIENFLIFSAGNTGFVQINPIYLKD